MAPPPVLKPDKVERDGAWLLFEPSTNSPAEVAQEIYLREFGDTDPRDLDSLAELCSVGMIRRIGLSEPARDLPTPEAAWQYAMDVTAKVYRYHLALTSKRSDANGTSTTVHIGSRFMRPKLATASSG
jgi:hypothetical protein